MKDIAFSTYVKQVLARKKIISEQESQLDKQYPHPTYRIQTLEEYITIVQAMQCYCEKAFMGEMIFRGVSNASFGLIPSLARLNCDLDRVEHEMIHEFVTSRPEAFSGLNSNFEILAKMQHYGLPTRLLDFSLNPLVALYFACEDSSKRKSDGRVICHAGAMASYDMTVIDCVCGTSMKGEIDCNEVIERYFPDGLSLYKYLFRIYTIANPLTAKPKYWNQRMINQSAVFMIFPNRIMDAYSRYANRYLKTNDINEATHCMFRIGSEDIRREVIETILQTENVCENYPDCDFHVTRRTWGEIRKSHKQSNPSDPFVFTDENKLLFNNRFTICNELETVDPDVIKHDFCSIIIDKNAKKKLLKQLSGIKIDIAYIYPELEYTAKKISSAYR